MKKTFFLIISIAALLLVFSACKKQSTPDPDIPYVPVKPNLTTELSGLGPNPGHPTGTAYQLPPNISIIGSIRGGFFGKAPQVKKASFTGPFPYTMPNKAWVYYGTGTYVDLYMELYNSSTVPATVSFPGGLIFCDSTDINDSVGIYQKGYILQTVNISIPALDTVQACIYAYCLNAHLMPSSYAAVYYIGPVTNNLYLNQVSTIMAPKQPPVGNEYSIQSIIWKVTDQGLPLDSTDITYLNGLP